MPSFGPVCHGPVININKDGHKVLVHSMCYGLLDIGAELELVLDIFGRKHGTVIQFAHIFGPVNDLEMSLLRHIACIA